MIKIQRRGAVKSADESRLDYYLAKGWTRVEDVEITAVLHPVKKNTVATPAVEVDASEEVVNDEQKGE